MAQFPEQLNVDAEHADKEVTAEQFKAAFRGHPGGVAVITADAGEGPVALTATSVASVNADPPLLMFSVTTASSATKVIVKAETVVVHLLDVDDLGLDAMDRRYLTAIAENYGGGPVGVETMAAALSEPRDAIEEIIEPYLLQQGFLQRTPRGRVLTANAYRHLGLAAPQAAAQMPLFDGEED